ncbi:site-specific integrase [Methanoregula sp.]|jgi:integrase|uniref:site-specific integrase n=1 Tax=Methanoregula sp. TaxID=2052170 RepID=UPI0025D06C4D|nr:site-specific integrase [Methanoregula sp.]
MPTDYSERSLDHALQEGTVTPGDADLIRRFCDDLQAKRDIGTGRRNKITSSLVTWRRFIEPFDTVNIPGIHGGIRALKTAKTWKGKPYAPNTVADMVGVLRFFFTWMIKEKLSKISLDELNEIKDPKRPGSIRRSSDLLTTEEFGALIRACRRDVDRAMVYTAYEGALRPGEVCQLRWQDLVFDDDGVKMNVEFKTRKPRYIRLVMAKEHLARWRSNYPGDPTGDALVFITRFGKPFTHSIFTKNLRNIAARAGIQKKITPHLLRHCRVTDLISSGAQESIVSLMCWGSVNSQMMKNYLHLSGIQVDDEIARLYGIKSVGRPKKGEEFKPRQCPSCGAVSSPTTRFCGTCGRSLSGEAENEEAEVRRFASSPDKLRRLADLMDKEEIKD